MSSIVLHACLAGGTPMVTAQRIKRRREKEEEEDGESRLLPHAKERVKLAPHEEADATHHLVGVGGFRKRHDRKSLSVKSRGHTTRTTHQIRVKSRQGKPLCRFSASHAWRLTQRAPPPGHTSSSGTHGHRSGHGPGPSLPCHHSSSRRRGCPLRRSGGARCHTPPVQ